MVLFQIRHGASHRHGVLGVEVAAEEEEAAAGAVEAVETMKFLRGEAVSTIMYTDIVNQEIPPQNRPAVTLVTVEAVVHILVLLIGGAIDQIMETATVLLLVVVVAVVVGEDVSKAAGVALPIVTDTVEIMADMKAKDGGMIKKTENPLAVGTRVTTSMASLRFVWLLRVVGETSVN